MSLRIAFVLLVLVCDVQCGESTPSQVNTLMVIQTCQPWLRLMRSRFILCLHYTHRADKLLRSVGDRKDGGRRRHFSSNEDN